MLVGMGLNEAIFVLSYCLESLGLELFHIGTSDAGNQFVKYYWCWFEGMYAQMKQNLSYLNLQEVHENKTFESLISNERKDSHSNNYLQVDADGIVQYLEDDVLLADHEGSHMK